MTSPITQFVDDCCMIDSAAYTSVNVLFKRWVDWCADNGRDHPGTVQLFGKQLTAAFPSVTKARIVENGERVRKYSGVRIKSIYD